MVLLSKWEISSQYPKNLNIFNGIKYQGVTIDDERQTSAGGKAMTGSDDGCCCPYQKHEYAS